MFVDLGFFGPATSSESRVHVLTESIADIANAAAQTGPATRRAVLGRIIDTRGLSDAEVARELEFVAQGALLMQMSVTPGMRVLVSPDLQADAQRALVFGSLQGGSFAVEGALREGVTFGNVAASGLLTLGQDAVNVVLLGPDAAFAADLITVAPLPTAEFAEGLFLETSPEVAETSRFLGGNAVLALVPFGGLGKADDSVYLFRAVSRAELEDILNVRHFRGKVSPEGFPMSLSAR